MANILITGVSGRIGWKAAEMFSKQFQVIGLDLVEPNQTLENVAFYKVDISSDRSMHEIMSTILQKHGKHIVSVIHLAAYYNFDGGHWDKYEAITIGGTRRLLKELKQFEVEQIIFSSTMLVFEPCEGEEEEEKINEEWPVNPQWEYPRSKIETENILLKEHGTSSLLILRIAGVYDDHCHSIPLAQQIQRIYENKLEGHLFPGDLTHGASYLHMEDLLNALLLSVQKRGEIPKEKILVIGEPETLSYEEIQEEIAHLLHHKSWKTFSIPQSLAKVGAWIKLLIPFTKKSFIKPWMIDLADDHYVLDITRAQNALGWQPTHSLHSSLPKMIAELKQDPKAWYLENGLKPKRRSFQ